MLSKDILKKARTNCSPDHIIYFDLGIIDYSKAFKIQENLFEITRQTSSLGFLLLLEHKPVITIGNNRNLDNLKINPEKLREQKISLIQSNRGGDITFHGPGQLIGYPIINLKHIKKDLALYVFNIEQLIIDFLSLYGIRGIRIPKHRGVFVSNSKIASIGIRIKKWISMHGFALNINTDLTYFENIIACGLKEYNQTSTEKILNKKLPLPYVKEQIIEKIRDTFKKSVIKI